MPLPLLPPLPAQPRRLSGCRSSRASWRRSWRRCRWAGWGAPRLLREGYSAALDAACWPQLHRDTAALHPVHLLSFLLPSSFLPPAGPPVQQEVCGQGAAAGGGGGAGAGGAGGGAAGADWREGGQVPAAGVRRGAGLALRWPAAAGAMNSSAANYCAANQDCDCSVPTVSRGTHSCLTGIHRHAEAGGKAGWQAGQLKRKLVLGKAQMQQRAAAAQKGSWVASVTYGHRARSSAVKRSHCSLPRCPVFSVWTPSLNTISSAGAVASKAASAWREAAPSAIDEWSACAPGGTASYQALCAHLAGEGWPHQSKMT